MSAFMFPVVGATRGIVCVLMRMIGNISRRLDEIQATLKKMAKEC